MNRLDPDLKRLLKWGAVNPGSEPPAEAPFGFAARVAAQWTQSKTREASEAWAGLASLSAWLSLAVIVAGCLFLALQQQDGRQSYEFSHTYMATVKNLLP